MRRAEEYADYKASIPQRKEMAEILEDWDSTVTVDGNIEARDGRITAGAVGIDGKIVVGGSITADGLVAVGAGTVGGEITIGDADEKNGEVNVTSINLGTGVAALAGKATVNGNINVNVEKAPDGEGTGKSAANETMQQNNSMPEETRSSSGVVLSGGEVRVNGDITVEGENGVGATLLSLGDDFLNLLTASIDFDQEMGYAGATDEEREAYKAERQKTIELLRELVGREANGENVLVVDGTITAQDGLMVTDNEAAAQVLQKTLSLGVAQRESKMEDAQQRYISSGNQGYLDKVNEYQSNKNRLILFAF